jgi:hypothetical protein
VVTPSPGALPARRSEAKEATMSDENRDEIRSLNETVFADLSIDEIESRLQMEEMDSRGEMWTGCNCADKCTDCPSFCPIVTCPEICSQESSW